MPGTHRKPKFLALNDLEVGMHVVVENRYSSEPQNGLVVNIVTNSHPRMIDGKPVGKQNNTRVTIAGDNGGEDLILTHENINRYQITKL